MNSRRRAALALLSILVSLPAGATTFYVATTGLDDVGCGVPIGNACRTIQFAYDNLPLPHFPPHEIRVLPGTYNECVIAWDFPTSDKPVRIVAEAWLTDQDNTQTVLDGFGICNPIDSGATVSLGGTGARLEGFTITNGGGSGVKAHGSVVITNNLITGNQATQGGGIYLYTATCYYTGNVNASITNNTITQNFARDTVSEPLGDGAGIWIWAAGFVPSPPTCLGGDANVTVQGNLITENIAENGNPQPFSLGAGVGVLINPNTLPAGGGAPATPGTARVVVTQNTISGNLSAAGTNVYGGGIWTGTYYAGDWTVEVTENEITGNAASSNGGGISTRFEDIQGNHTLLFEGNDVSTNQSLGSGGGIDVLAFHSLIAGNTFSFVARENTVSENSSSVFGGGIFAEYASLGSIAVSELADFPAAFPAPPSPADEVTFLLEGNTVSGNAAVVGAGGVALQVTANGDPTSLPPLLCDPLLPAVARVGFVNNLVTGNSVDTPLADMLLWVRPGCSDLACQDTICGNDPFCCGQDPVLGGFWDNLCVEAALADPTCFPGCIDGGGTSNCCLEPKVGSGTGVLIRTEAIGPAVAVVDIETSTVAGNLVLDEGFVGGIETAALTGPDCDIVGPSFQCGASGPCFGETHVTINRSIVALNDKAGIGGPLHAPDDRLTLEVTRSSSFGHGPPDPDYEDTLFPGTVAPPGNILQDPQLDPGSYVPAVCSPAYDIGTCATDSRICQLDSECKVCTGGTNLGLPCTLLADCPGVGGACGGGECVAEGAGYFASPDSNGDDIVDGRDIIDLALGFGDREDNPAPNRYDPTVDLDRNGILDGVDLSLMAPVFGEVCP